MLERIDVHPTHTVRPTPSGRQGVSFGATRRYPAEHLGLFPVCDGRTLVLFEKGDAEPFAEISSRTRVPDRYVWTMIKFSISTSNALEYGYRMMAPSIPQRATVSTRRRRYWTHTRGSSVGAIAGAAPGLVRRIIIIAPALPSDDFDWEHDRPLETPIQDPPFMSHMCAGVFLTADPSSGVKHPGTFAAIRDKNPLSELPGAQPPRTDADLRVR